MPAFTVQKSIRIDKEPNAVFELVRDLKKWALWSPWTIAEPDCKLTYSEDGLSYDWDGQVIGAGQLKITNDDAPHSVNYDLSFLKPWKSFATVQFDLKPVAGGTEAVWTMNSSLPFFMFWMKKMMVAMIGMDFDRGLKMLKVVAEEGAVPVRLEFVGPTSQAACDYIGVTTETSLDKIGEAMRADFGKLKQWICEQDAKPTGAPFSTTHRFDMVNRIAQYTVAYPLAEKPSTVPAGFVTGERPATPTYAIKHTGPYEYLANAWAAGMMRVQSKVIRQNKKLDCFEVYENNPDETPANERITTVHFPTK